MGGDLIVAKVFNPGEKVVLDSGEVGTVVCVHSYPNRGLFCDVRLPGGRLSLIPNSELERHK